MAIVIQTESLNVTNSEEMIMAIVTFEEMKECSARKQKAARRSKLATNLAKSVNPNIKWHYEQLFSKYLNASVEETMHYWWLSAGKPALSKSKIQMPMPSNNG